MAPRRVVVTGSGVAGLTAARLLLQRGYDVTLRANRSGAGPAIVLKDDTLRLLQRVWDLSEDAPAPVHRISERAVHAAAHSASLPELAWSLDAGALQEHLLRHLRAHGARVSCGSEANPEAAPRAAGGEVWHIDATGRSGAATRARQGTTRVSCGRRAIVASRGSLRDPALAGRCVFEAVPQGWLFAAAVDRSQVTVQLMLPAPHGSPAAVLHEAVAASVFARETLLTIDPEVSTWDAAPAFDDPWPTPRTIRVGDAVMAFDPICGDGTGHAIRGALLAAAAVDATERGGDAAGVRRHYVARLRLAWAGHLRTCCRVYASLDAGGLWTGEIARMSGVLSTSAAWVPAAEALRFRLLGSRLVSVRSIEA
jgi:flavin-dependent dehydrogenase